MPAVRVLAKFVIIRNYRLPPDPITYHRGEIFESDDVDQRELVGLFNTYGLNDHSKLIGRLQEERRRDFEERIRRNPHAKGEIVAEWRNPAWLDRAEIPAVEWVSPRAVARIPTQERMTAEERVADLRRQLGAAEAEIVQNQMPPRDEHGRFRKRGA